MKKLTYEERLKKLQLPTLRYRRLKGDMIETYKMMTGVYDQGAIPTLEREPNSLTRGNSLKLLKQHCKTSLKFNSFNHRIVNAWNSMPEKVISAPSIPAFERRLDNHWANLEIKYSFDAPLCLNVKTKTRIQTDLDTQDR